MYGSEKLLYLGLGGLVSAAGHVVEYHIAKRADRKYEEVAGIKSLSEAEWKYATDSALFGIVLPFVIALLGLTGSVVGLATHSPDLIMFCAIPTATHALQVAHFFAFAPGISKRFREKN